MASEGPAAKKAKVATSTPKLLLARPKVAAPLDPNFAPLVLGKRQYLAAAKDASCAEKLEWALLRDDGCARYSLPVFPEGSEHAEASSALACFLLQEMLWQRSASELRLVGPAWICNAVKAAFSDSGAHKWEVKIMPSVCGTPDKAFQVNIVSSSELPEEKNMPQETGKSAKGCRLAFDLGKSDLKTVAVKDDEVLYSKETEWDVTNPDPEYHIGMIVTAMKLAKEKLPHVDAIGGSATGPISANNEARFCDCFPNVPPDVYKAKVVNVFARIAKEVAGDVPLKVVNDGEVTAIAAYQKIKQGNVFGLSMGSSAGAGYADADGNLNGWINEMCHTKLDLNPEAHADPWSEFTHTGLAHMYLGQRACTKFVSKLGIDVPEHMVYPHPNMCTVRHEDHANCLKLIQKAMADPAQEAKVTPLYETVGVYLGYALAQWAESYKIDHVMILGRVSKGKGGDIMLATAQKVLQTDFPELPKIKFHTADDHFKAVGQCIAAAALPPLN